MLFSNCSKKYAKWLVI